jgi:hypothetical protein
MEEKNTFFTPTKEKIFIAAFFLGARLLLGYINRINLAAKMPFFVNMILAATDFVVSLPMKLVFATPSLKIVAKSELLLTILFLVMITYWYLFACVLIYSYDLMNANDAKKEENKAENQEVQSKLV